MAPRRQNAFTLVELLVVISIIGMLMALLLPAVNSVRENARRLACSNQVQQIAKGMLGYVTNRDAFPGYRGNRAGAGSNPILLDTSWFVAISPQLEQGVIKDRYDQFLSTQIPSFPFVDFVVCPSDPAEQLTPGANNPISHLSYVVNAGRQDPPSFNPSSAQPPDDEANGVFHDLRHPKSPKVRLGFKDGASNTLMLTENKQATYWSHRSPNDQILESYVAFVFAHDPKWFDQNGDLLPNFRAAAINEQKDRLEPVPRPSSNHSGGVNVAFCDAHVMFLREDINYRVLQQLMTPDGFHRDCDVPSTGQNGQPMPNTNKAYILNSADYTSQ